MRKENTASCGLAGLRKTGLRHEGLLVEGGSRKDLGTGAGKRNGEASSSVLSLSREQSRGAWCAAGERAAGAVSCHEFTAWHCSSVLLPSTRQLVKSLPAAVLACAPPGECNSWCPRSVTSPPKPAPAALLLLPTPSSCQRCRFHAPARPGEGLVPHLCKLGFGFS